MVLMEIDLLHALANTTVFRDFSRHFRDFSKHTRHFSATGSYRAMHSFVTWDGGVSVANLATEENPPKSSCCKKA